MLFFVTMFVSFRGDCKRFGQPHFFLIRDSIKMVSLVEEQVIEPVVVKKNKKNKKRKLEAENEATLTETVVDVNCNPDVKQKKKKKKNKENVDIAVVEESLAPAVEEPVKKKKKKSKDKEATDDQEASDETGEAEESGPFKKKFYTMSSETEAMTKSEVKSYQSEHHITMYGKGRKTFKPLRTFKDLGLSDAIMKVTSGFKAPTPIQAQCWPVLASGRDIIGIAETGSGKKIPLLPFELCMRSILL